jgi:hypothetical protein
MSKQTAVNFLIKEFSDILGPLDTKPMQDLLMMDAIKKAKAMEKEQIIDAVNFGQTNYTDTTIEDKEIAEQYYEQTYGGNK